MIKLDVFAATVKTTIMKPSPKHTLIGELPSLLPPGKIYLRRVLDSAISVASHVIVCVFQ